MAAPSVADTFYHHISLETVSISDGSFRSPAQRFWVFTVYMQDGCFDQLAVIRAATRSAGIIHVGCEAYLVIQNQMHSAFHSEGRQF